MVQYIISAVKLENCIAIDWLDLFSYDDKTQALKEARSIADGASPTIQALNGFTDIIVHECMGDVVGNCIEYTKVARFKILK